jgi:hypothetical protein
MYVKLRVKFNKSDLKSNWGYLWLYENNQRGFQKS